MKNVLIVEDSKAIRSMIRVSLEEAGGFFAVEAGNGFEALKTLPTRRFDLIITDINMPDINGLELIGYVKSNPTYRDIPLIIVSTEKTRRGQEARYRPWRRGLCREAIQERRAHGHGHEGA